MRRPRRGKKMGTFHVTVRSSGAPLADVDFRFDTKTGTFFADYSDEEFENVSRDALCEIVTAFVQERHTVDRSLPSRRRRAEHRDGRAMKPPRKRKKRAVLGAPDLKRIREAAKGHSALAHALVEWLYTNGQRASEPGLARMDDLDLHTGTVLLTHLKGGLDADPMPLSSRCKDALVAWFVERKKLELKPGAKDYVFPSSSPHTCYPCRGSRKVTVKSRKTRAPQIVPCPHCHATGTRWGMSRYEVSRLVITVFKMAEIPEGFHFPHVLRHSAVTHMLNSGSEPPEIQERVGHKALATTFGYMHTTDKARAKVTKAFDTDEE